MPFRVIGVELTAKSTQYTSVFNQASQTAERFFNMLQRAGRGAGEPFRQASNGITDYANKARQAQQAQENVGRGAKQMSNEVVSGAGRMNSALNSVVQTATGFTVGMMALQGIQAVFRFASDAIIGFNSKLQNAEIGFTTMLGSGEAATKMLGDLRTFALQTPFEFPDLLEASKRMLALGFASKDIIPNLTAIGDAAAGLDSGAQGIQRITLALGQMSAKGKVNAQDMRQLTEAGIKAWQILADKQGVSVREIMRQSEAGTLSAAVAVPQLLEGMEDRFGGLMDKMSHTWSGALSNIKDASLQFLAAGARPFFNALASGADALSKHLQSKEFQAWIVRVGEAGARAFPVLIAAFSRLSPMAVSLARSVMNLAKIFISVGEAVAPAVGFLLKMVAIPIIGWATAAARGLELLTGWLVKNKGAALVLAAVLTGVLAPAFIRAMAVAIAGAWETIALRFMYAGDAAIALGRNVMAMSMTMKVGLGLAAAAAIGMAFYMDWASKQTDKNTDALIKRSQNFKGSYAEEAANINRLVDRYNSLNAQYDASQWTVARFGHAANAQKNELAKLGPVIDQLNAAHEEHAKKIRADAEASGLSVDQFEKVDSALGDMADDWIKAMGETSRVTLMTGDEIYTMFGKDTEAIKAFGKAVDDAMKNTQQAFTADTDVIANVGRTLSSAQQEAESSAKTHTAALDKQKEAQKSLSQLEARRAADKKISVADDQALTNARDKLAKANDEVTNSTVKTVNAQQEVRDFYRKSIADTERFTKNINDAIQRGLSPQLVSRMLQQGPQAAGPILEAILSDHSGRMIAMVNDSEKRLAEINTQAILNARLTQMAISAPTEDMAKNVKTAMEISQREFAAQGKLTAQQLADAMKMTPDQIKAVADSYKITIPPPTFSEIPQGPATAGAKAIYGKTPDGRTYKTTPQGTFYLAPNASDADLQAFYSNARGGFYERHHPAVYGSSVGRRQFNEPEAGGESYIPHAPSKRGGAVAVLRQTASALGVRSFASGGFYMPRSAVMSGGNSWSQSKTIQYNFLGDIQGVKLEDAERYADQKKRLTNLAGAR